MKFSVLIPTRDRLELLRYAVDSVRVQDYDNWEVVISDNASSTDVAAYVASLGDPRIRYSRTSRLLPVTDNWNRALELSSGEFIIMLGDDDALMPQCLRAVRMLADRWDGPDAIYTEALQYAYPGVVPGHEAPFVQTGYTEFFRERGAEPFLLPRRHAERLARQAAQFRIRYGFNMQHFIYSRRLVDKLRGKGPFFQSPYPDYYAANAIFLSAERILANPHPLVIIGISPKSFGYYFQNRRESEGVAFLQTADEARTEAAPAGRLVPGTNMNDSWLRAMERLSANFPEARIRVSYRRYRLLQYHALVRQHGRGAAAALLSHARWWEWVLYAPMVALYGLGFLLPRALRVKVQDLLRTGLSAYPRFDARRRSVTYQNILEAARGHGA